MTLRWYLLLVLAGCSRSHSPDQASSPQPSPVTSTPASQPSAATPPAPKAVGGLVWDAQPPLVRRQPRTPVRAAEYGVEGDAQAELVVFYMGNQPTGSIDANVQRWLIQFEQPDGSDTAQRAKQRELDVAGLAVHTVEVSGVYTGPTTLPSVSPGSPLPQSTLLGAIVKGPKGDVFFKLIGSRPTVERARDAFERLLRSIRPIS